MDNLDEDRSVSNAVTELDVFINRPVGEVWNQFIDFGSWVTSHRIEEIHGRRGTIGSIFRASFKNSAEEGYPLPHHHYCKIIKVIPEQLYVLKTYSEKGGSYGVHIVAFDEARFVSKDGGTLLTFKLFAEFSGERIAQNPGAINMDASQDGMVKNLNNLKRIVESH